jgi:hypothetical protein
MIISQQQFCGIFRSWKFPRRTDPAPP